jgi:hypothetical protein
MKSGDNGVPLIRTSVLSSLGEIKVAEHGNQIRHCQDSTGQYCNMYTYLIYGPKALFKMEIDLERLGTSQDGHHGMGRPLC